MSRSTECPDKTQFPFNEMPLSDERRKELLIRLTAVKPPSFNGSLADLFMLQEMWCMRIGPNDEWLLNLAHRNRVFN